MTTFNDELKAPTQYKYEAPFGTKVAVTDKDLHKIYVNTAKGLQEYMGGSNFANGKRKCPHCSSNMERSPIRQQYVKVKGGKILIDIRGDGISIVSKADPAWAWFCTGCVLSIGAGK